MMRPALFTLALVVGGACASADQISAEPPALADARPARVGWRAFVGPRFLASADDERLYEAVVVDERGRIAALHETKESVPDVPLVELPGALALPGLHDAHLHIEGIGARATELDLRGTVSVDDLRARVARYVEANGDLAVIVGRGFDQSAFADGRYPTRHDLAGITERPVLLRRVDGHAVVVNDEALRLAGVTRDTSDPDGGQILRDERGEPLGVLIDNAMSLVDVVRGTPSDDEIVRRLQAGLAACADAGLTSVHDMGMSARSYRLLVALAARETLPVRVFAYLDAEDRDALALLDEDLAAPRVSLKGLKVFADGAMGSRGALLLADYDDAPGHRGLAVTGTDRLVEHVQAASARQKQAAIHAIGDLGVRRALEAVAAVDDAGAHRHRIEHAQLVAPSDFASFAALGVVASMQPLHATSDMHFVVARIGPTRARTAYAWRTMRTHGVPLAFGSDAPVESEQVTLGFFAALTRRLPSAPHERAFFPEERLFFGETLDAFTRGAAYAAKEEASLGALVPGAELDLTLLDRDPRETPEAWLATVPVATVVGGTLRAGARVTKP